MSHPDRVIKARYNVQPTMFIHLLNYLSTNTETITFVT
jgi:hypothetical protein